MTLHPGAIAAADPQRAAVIIGEHELTYGELEHASACWAAHLAARGLGFGDTLAMLIGNSADFFILAWAAQRSGLYYLPIPTRLTTTEVGFMLADSGAKLLVADASLAPLARASALPLGIPVTGVDVPATKGEPPPPLEGGDLLYTSGTTGRPKSIRRPLSGAPLGSDGRRVERARRLFGLDAGSVFLSPAPLYHAAPLRFTMNLLRIGGTVVGMVRFDAAAALALIGQHRVTHSQWVPTMFSRLLGLPEAVREAADLTTHRVAIHAGAPCPPAIKRAMIDWWGPILHEYYSGTESIGFTHVTAAEWLERPGTVGRAVEARLRITDEDGRERPVGKTGLVCFETASGPHADRPSASAWATMGDIGHVDADGYLYLSDRRAFTIISGGVNIYPAEVEAALSNAPGVADVAVFGLPDDDLGETVVAVIELVAPQTASGAVADDLRRTAARTLARHKLPRRILFGAVGRSETGKIAKAALQRRCAALPRSDYHEFPAAQRPPDLKENDKEGMKR